METNTNTTAMERAGAALTKKTRGASAASTVKDVLERAMPEIRNALPKHMTPERMIRIAFSAISRNPTLLKCTPMSLAKAVIEASELGLEPSGILGHAYLVPYQNRQNGQTEAQLQIGYRGFIELAGRSGRIRSINAEVVYEGDEFEFLRGTEEFLRHRADLDRPDDAAPRCAYAVAHYKDGGVDFELVSLAKIEQAKRSSKTADRKDSPWQLYPEEMMRKTAIRRLAKRLPLSPELLTSAVRDEYREAGVSIPALELSTGDDAPEEKPTKPITIVGIDGQEVDMPAEREREAGQEG